MLTYTLSNNLDNLFEINNIHKLSDQSIKETVDKYKRSGIFKTGPIVPWNKGLIGVSKSPEHSKRMSGKGNPNWIGYYITPWGKFETLTEASKESPTGMSSGRLKDLCYRQYKVKTKNKYNLEVGKTPKEIGYYMELI
jgi:hypothetical protein